MKCELFLTQMYVERPGDGSHLPPDFADHLRTCASCSRQFARLVEQDASIRQTIRLVSAPPTLEEAIFSGLALERTGLKTNNRVVSSWKEWLWIPVAVAVLVVVSVFGYTQWRFHSVLYQAENFLHASPLMSVGGDRDQILRWTGQVEPGAGALPSRLGRVQFLGATTVEVDHRAAVLLRMKHEPRASLLILDGSRAGSSNVTTRSADDGSLAYWSEQKKTYVLLFLGDKSELHSYMQRMGITA